MGYGKSQKRIIIFMLVNLDIINLDDYSSDENLCIHLIVISINSE